MESSGLAKVGLHLFVWKDIQVIITIALLTQRMLQCNYKPSFVHPCIEIQEYFPQLR